MIKAMTLTAAASVCLLAMGCGSTQTVGNAADSTGPINTMCPVGEEPVVAEIGTVSYKGSEIAFCCNGCKEYWDTMSDEDRDAYVASVKRGEEASLMQ